MSALFGNQQPPPVQPPPPPPTITDPRIAMRADEERRQRGMQGRASQFMSDPQTQTKPTPDKARQLTGAL